MRRNYTERDGADHIHGPGRSPSAWLPWLGMNLLSYFADAGSGGGYGGHAGGYKSEPGKPCNEPIGPVKCCFLACPNTECHYEGDKSKYTCPEGFQRQWWFCCEGTQQIGCGECATGDSCGAGPWACSIWWETGATC